MQGVVSNDQCKELLEMINARTG